MSDYKHPDEGLISQYGLKRGDVVTDRKVWDSLSKSSTDCMHSVAANCDLKPSKDIQIAEAEEQLLHAENAARLARVRLRELRA